MVVLPPCKYLLLYIADYDNIRQLPDALIDLMVDISLVYCAKAVFDSILTALNGKKRKKGVR